MALEEELVTLERQIKLESDKLAERKGEATGVVFVTVSVQGSCRVEFKLTYSKLYAAYVCNMTLILVVKLSGVLHGNQAMIFMQLLQVDNRRLLSASSIAPVCCRARVKTGRTPYSP